MKGFKELTLPVRWSVTAAGLASSLPERSLPHKLMLPEVAQDLHCRVEKSGPCGGQGTGGGFVPTSLVSAAFAACGGEEARVSRRLFARFGVAGPVGRVFSPGRELSRCWWCSPL